MYIALLSLSRERFKCLVGAAFCQWLISLPPLLFFAIIYIIRPLITHSYSQEKKLKNKIKNLVTSILSTKFSSNIPHIYRVKYLFFAVRTYAWIVPCFMIIDHWSEPRIPYSTVENISIFSFGTVSIRLNLSWSLYFSYFLYSSEMTFLSQKL